MQNNNHAIEEYLYNLKIFIFVGTIVILIFITLDIYTNKTLRIELLILLLIYWAIWPTKKSLMRKKT